MNELETLFQQLTNEKLLIKEELSASGSNRKYFRLESKNTAVIGVEGTSVEENRSFIEISKHFYKLGLPVPEFLLQSSDGLCYIQEDLGDTLLFDYIADGRKTGLFHEKEKEMLRKTMRKLAKIQVLGAKGLDFSLCYPQPEFNERSILWDLNYFKYCFLKATGLDFQENRLEDDFKKLSDILLSSKTDTFMYRDFQSRNVMIKDEQPYFIDFQGGRKGPVYYDVASFLWQAKAKYSPELRDELLEVYLESLNKLMPVDKTFFCSRLKHFVLFRTLQVLGAYGFRGYFEKKPHFLQSIPFALENLRAILRDSDFEYSYLIDILKQMTELKQFREVSLHKPLVVKVYSFSYKKGIPNDDSGNGGGFVFDCRAVNNPGKYERYTHLTGLDESVIKFLEEDGEITKFLESAYSLVDASVKRYKDRGFTNLMISFGCTGGQHRSVYSAQKMAEHINEKFGVEVQLIHREQNKEELFCSRN
ncbi:phosphotransferase [Paludibacter sp. 221]|uniref:RapZ C-terminal domain-containing protein n=1 Tax=Paludibacter sp. 221 TaxID=2302939 RepID=UPI0013D68E9B|nr:RNase adapter RapZ [Paludibacter sp. 221]NDV47105.1 phosphotransferase [Paludibacter sp. 221]